MRPSRSLTLAGATVASLALRPTIALRPGAVHVDATPVEVIDRLRRRLESGAEILVADESTIVARFSGQAGVLPYRTIELVSLGEGFVDFEHLAGPFAAAAERISADAAGSGSRVEHTGRIVMRGGLLGWVLGMLVVRPLFERHVDDHLHEMFEPRDGRGAATAAG